MPKGIDPKAYAARITKAKKTVAAMDPATRAKIKNMYPKVTREEVVKQALDTKKVDMKKKTGSMKPDARRTPSTGAKKIMPKVGPKPAAKIPKPQAPTGPKKPMAKPLTGPAAVEALQKRVSPAGVKKAESGAKKAIDKKYPGLYKKSK